MGIVKSIAKSNLYPGLDGQKERGSGTSWMDRIKRLYCPAQGYVSIY